MDVFWVMLATNGLLLIAVIALSVSLTRRPRAGSHEAEVEKGRVSDNERRLESIWKAEPQGILVLSLDYRVQLINPAGCLVFDAGFPEEVMGRDVRDFIQSDDRHLIEDMYQATLNSHEACGTWRLVGLSRQVRWVESRLAPLPTDHGTVQAVLAVVRDITEQKHADRRQALQHAVTKVLAESSTVEQAIPELLRAITMSLNWRVGLFWQVEGDHQRITCTEDWSVDTTMLQQFIQASRQQAYCSWHGLPGRCWAKGEPVWVEDVTSDSTLVTRVGSEATKLRSACAFPVWLRANVYGVMEFFSGEGQSQDWGLLKVLGTVGSQLSLFLERTEVEAALHENEERTRLIIDTALDAVITMDRDGRITEWNTQAERTFGWSAHEVIGCDLAETIIASTHRARYVEYLERLVTPRERVLADRLIEMVGIRHDTHEFPMELAVTPLIIGDSVLFSAFIRDITGRKEAERSLKDYAERLEHINHQLDAAFREAKAATEAKSSFLATMSHEIRTPMNGVIGMTGLLLETTLTDEQREYAQTVRTCGEHLLTIINDILDFSKIEAGRLELEMIDFDFRLVIEESLELVAERAASKGLNLACLFHAEVPRNLVGDPGRLRQVVMNLVSNAVKFTEQGDVVVEVTVEGQAQNDATIRVTVTDTGIGIAKEVCQRLFQSFSQADGSTTRKYGGTGLGLAICKRLIELMGGTIGVSSHIGQGSCFWFTLTLSKQVGAFSSPELSPAALAGLRVMIVDDKPVNRRILELMTKKWGMFPTLVADGSEALGLLTRDLEHPPQFELALLDVDMGAMSGIELAYAMKNRAIGGEIRLILLTSLGRRGDAKAAREAGLAAYLTKPVREQQLYDCLVTVMNRRAVSSPSPGTGGPPPLITRHTLAESKAKVDLRILLAEDNLINQKVAVRLFQRLGHRIDVVSNGREAVDALARVRYDLVFMDCQMPEMDGFEATHLIRQREAAGRVSSCEREGSGLEPNHSGGRPEPQHQKSKIPHRVRIIAMTANAMSGDRERCLAAGMDDYIAKPISVAALVEALDRAHQESPPAQCQKSQDAA